MKELGTRSLPSVNFEWRYIGRVFLGEAMAGEIRIEQDDTGFTWQVWQSLKGGGASLLECGDRRTQSLARARATAEARAQILVAEGRLKVRS